MLSGHTRALRIVNMIPNRPDAVHPGVVFDNAGTRVVSAKLMVFTQG